MHAHTCARAQGGKVQTEHIKGIIIDAYLITPNKNNTLYCVMPTVCHLVQAGRLHLLMVRW